MEEELLELAEAATCELAAALDDEEEAELDSPPPKQLPKTRGKLASSKEISFFDFIRNLPWIYACIIGFLALKKR